MIYLKGSKIKLQGSEQTANVFLGFLLTEDEISQAKEHFHVMHLDIRSRINMVELVNIGTLSSSLVHPRETRRAIIQGSAAIIVAHNHRQGRQTLRRRMPN